MLKQLKFILLHIRDSGIPGRDGQAGTAGTKVLLAGSWPGPGPDMEKNSYPGTRPGPKIEGHPGAGPGAVQRFQPPAGTRTQISVPRRPLVGMVYWHLADLLSWEDGN